MPFAVSTANAPFWLMGVELAFLLVYDLQDGVVVEAPLGEAGFAGALTH
jgi:hypothetical protein